MDQFKCVCGFNGKTAHAIRCKDFIKEVDRIAQNISGYIEEYYKETYSITACCIYVKEREQTELYVSRLRVIITKKLDELGVREKIDGKNLNIRRQEKTKATMLKKYGVANAGQILGNGFGKRNQIPYPRLKVSVAFSEYRKAVDQLSWKHLEKLKKKGTVPTVCYYTGIPFADNQAEEVNPNHPFKRTVDHKVPISEAFLLGWSPAQAASESNLAYCLRIVNTLKGSTDENRFTAVFVPALKEKLENEDL